MKKLSLLPILFIMMVPSIRAQSSDPNEVITEIDVTHLISTLSADSMMGRKTFTPSIQKSAEFIAEQFREIGLTPLNDGESFLQNFKVHNLRTQTRKLVLNGKKLDDSAYFVISDQPVIHWSSFPSEQVHTILETDNFQTAFSKWYHMSGNAVILVDEAHRNIFDQYARHFSQSTQTMTVNSTSTKLFVLTDSRHADDSSFDRVANVEELPAFNVAGKITGTSKKDEYVIFSAHYDHLGVLTPVEGDSIANGADDDASGSAAVIMLAKYFKNIGPQPRTLIFIAFTGEEEGGYGSTYFSNQLDPEQIAAMFNIEMIGKPSKFGPGTAFLTGFHKSDMGKILQESLKHSPYKIYPDPYPDQHLFYRSDNARLARLGVPAHTISSDQIDKDPYYHTVNDELKTLDLEHLTHMIRAIAISSKTIVTGKDTPSRVDTTSLN